MSDPNVLLAIDGSLATITINRPEKRNALDLPTVEHFHEALVQIARAGCTVFIVTGAGDRSFVAGADINAIKARRRNDALAGINSMSFFFKLPDNHTGSNPSGNSHSFSLIKCCSARISVGAMKAT